MSMYIREGTFYSYFLSAWYLFLLCFFHLEKRTNHAMVCIGYGIEDNKEPYWILKNTWGPLWGDNGYIKISQKGNIANIHGGQLLTIKKNHQIPEFPYQSLKKVKRSEKLYKHLATISV